MFEDATVLLTGGTGSFGHAFTQRLLGAHKPQKLIIFSRDEMKQWEMEKRFGEDNRIRFFIGDVRDRDRVYRALDGVDYVVHAAASKIVTTAEYNPFETVKTNVLGAMNIIEASIDRGVRHVVALSTDKASSPVNLYGATKLTSDRLFAAGGVYSGKRETKFSVVRYGNVMGSRGSVIPYFLELAKKNQPLRITDRRMTRFMITLDDAISLVETAFRESSGGEIFVKKIPSMNIMDIADAIEPNAEREIVGIRPGEKLHEQMIGPEDAPNTYEFEDHFRIFSPLGENSLSLSRGNNGTPVAADFSYSSDSNEAWMSVSELREWIRLNEDSFLQV